MKKLILAFLAVLVMALSIPDAADAARMGGGRSMGSKPFMSVPAPRPQATMPGAMQNRPMTNQARPQAQAPAAGGMMGGMGGFFGGMLAGSLLGSLFGGHGAAAGAAGEGGMGFLDILLIGLLIYFGLKFFRSRAAARQQPQPAGGYDNGQYQQPQGMQYSGQPSSQWDNLRSTPQQGGAGAFQNGGNNIPADFDQEDFLRGAKMAYTRMQQSWDRRDLDDIAQFATEAIMKELRVQAQEDPNPSRTDLLTINAELLHVEDTAEGQRAEVLFDVLMREDPNQSQPEQVREIWHFLRAMPDNSWRLDGIQQTR